MALRRTVLLAMLAALCGLPTGCASSGFGWWGNRQASNLNTASVSSIAQQPAKPSWGSSIASGFKSTSDKVASALTIKPKVIPADDPIKLTSHDTPVGPELFVSTAKMYESRGEFEAAGGQYRKALEISPKNLPALLGYARLKDRQNKFDEASKLYKKAIAAHPKSATAYNDLGLCQGRHNQPEAALESLERAVSLDPASKLYRNNLATMLVDAGRTNEAFEHLVLAHGEAVAHYNLGYLLFQRNKTEQANQQFALAAEKDSSLTQARDMLNRTSSTAAVEPGPTVQKTQHLSESPFAPTDAEPAISSPFATLGRGAKKREQPSAEDSSLKSMVVNPFATKRAPSDAVESETEFEPASEPNRESGGELEAEPVGETDDPSPSDEGIAAAEIPQHVFPPIRLPQVIEEDEADAAPAPLPSDEAGVPSRSRALRALPRVEDE